jgi:hypothetical protein
MTVSFEVGVEFLLREDLPLSPEDLRFGLEKGWLHTPTVIQYAVREVEKGATDSILLDTASLLPDEVDKLGEILAQLDDPFRVYDPRRSHRIWLYVQLKAAYERREELADPLGVIEEIYADFDYPPTIADLVRYMPLRDGDEPGVAAILQRWHGYLTEELEALRRL